MDCEHIPVYMCKLLYGGILSAYRLLLLQEKEQLLRELRSIDPKGRSGEEMNSIYQRIAQLEYDLKHALQISNKQIQERYASSISSGIMYVSLSSSFLLLFIDIISVDLFKQLVQ